jgi:hypothetical protein
MSPIEMVNSINENWTMAIFIFALGGMWWQFKSWIRRLTEMLRQSSITHSNQNIVLDGINKHLDSITVKVEKMEKKIDEIHSDVHAQAIKIAVLEAKSKS